MKYFIWTLGKTPQIWYEKPVDGSGKTKRTLVCVELENHDNRNIEKLKIAYPCPIEAKG